MKKFVMSIVMTMMCCIGLAQAVGAEDFDFEAFQKYLTTLKKQDMKYKQVIIDKFTISDSEKVDRDHEPEQMLKMVEVSLADILSKANLFDDVHIRANQPNTQQALIIKAELIDLRIVSSTKRFFMGALAGNSGMEIKVNLVDGTSNKTIHEFNIRDETNAFSGAYTVGGSDRNVPINVAEQMSAVVVKKALVGQQ